MRHIGVVGAMGALSVVATGHASDMDVAGYWLMNDGSSIVQIDDCGDGTPCGTVIWLDESRAKVLIDNKNPDENLRGREVVGISILNGFQRKSTSWRSGRIYNPEDGRTYRSRLKLVSKNVLAVSGCLGPICKKMHWERAEAAGLEAAQMRSELSEVPASL